MANIVLRNISKEYDKGVSAVKEFNLNIDDKEFIVFVGPSGCGKTTTLRMIAGLENITEGELYIDGQLINDVSPKNRDIAMVFQNYALYPHMSVYENMAFGLKMRKIPKREIEKRVLHTSKILGLDLYLDRKPKALSGGQRQRVALGRAIVRDAKVFLMDEPLSNLDAKLRIQMRTEIVKLHQRLQTTTIYVTHDQTEAMTMATRLVVMKDGIIQQADTPKEIYENPANKFVGSFIGSPAMNFIVSKFEGEKLWIGNTPICMPDEKVSVLRALGYEGKEIYLGIRPENINLLNLSNTEQKASINGKVEVTELLGPEMLLYCELENEKVIARVEPDFAIKPGQEIQLALDMDKAHFFDINNEAVIRLDKSSTNKIVV